MSINSPVPVRMIATTFAAVLALQAVWIVGAEMARPGAIALPANPDEAQAIATDNSAAATAAWIGWPRGALWADYAVTANADRVGQFEANTPVPPASQDSNAVAETAAVLEPSDARSWVLLAMNAQAGANDAATARTIALLKMSYYTSPFSDDLFALRLRIAAKSNAMSDEELAIYAEYELGTALRDKAAIKASLASAYAHATPTGRAFLERVLGKLDPNFLADMKPKS